MGLPAQTARRTATAVLFIVAFAGLFAAWPRPAAAAVLLDAQTPRYDRVFKVGLLEQLPSPPELVIFGGSRAQRFEPSFAEKLTGLPAFNFAVQNSRPEDVYAMSRLLFWRAFKTYLGSLRGTYRFHVLDCTELASFHGDPNAFYDGAHVTAVNARRILVQAVKDAPLAFR